MGIITHDITARKQIEQDLKDQRDFVTQVINAMGQGLTVSPMQTSVLCSSIPRMPNCSVTSQRI